MPNKKLVFIDSGVPARNVLIDNISLTVTVADKVDSLKNINFLEVEQIGFIWKNEFRGRNKPHFHNFFYFDDNKTEPIKYGSEKEIAEIVKNFPNLKYIDLITCELSDKNEWKEEFDKLKSVLNEKTEIRYSTNRTGTIMLNTDWILESHNVSILDEYFDGKDFEYKFHLAPSPLQTIDNFKNNININSGSNIIQIDNDILEITDDITIDIDSYDNGTGTGTGWAPIDISSNINYINGNNHKITFVKNNLSNPNIIIPSIFYRSSLNNLVIKNIIVDGSSALIFNGLVYSIEGDAVRNAMVINCGVTNLELNGGINDNYGTGFIFGAYAGSNGGNAIAISCYSTGNCGVTNAQTSSYLNIGFIFGSYAGSNGGKAIAISCYSTGDCKHSGYENASGLIFGPYTAYYGGTAIAIGCYSNGNLEANTGADAQLTGGLIFGNNSGYGSNSNVYAIGCYTTGNTYAQNYNYAGHIFGIYSGGSTGNVYAYACYSTGTASGGNVIGGLIYGWGAANAYAIACYSTGDIDKITNYGYGGLIFGEYSGYGPNTKSYAIGCFATGKIIHPSNTNLNKGALFGRYAGFNGGNSYAIACYSSYQIQSDASSNILFGDLSVPSRIYAEQCYFNYIGSWKYIYADNTFGDISGVDLQIYNYNSTISEVTNQLKLRFFSVLPWNPFSPFDQKPFLMDLSIYNPTNYYKLLNISIDNIIINDISDAKNLFKDLLDPQYSLDNYTPINSNLKIQKLVATDISNNINNNDIIYITSTNEYLQYNDNKVNIDNIINAGSDSAYRVYSQFPIIYELMSITNGIPTLYQTPTIYQLIKNEDVELKNKDGEIAIKDGEIASKDVIIANKDTEIANKTNIIQNLNNKIKKLNNEIKRLNNLNTLRRQYTYRKYFF